MLFGRSLKLLLFRLRYVIPADLLSLSDVLLLECSEPHGPEECKHPDQDL